MIADPPIHPTEVLTTPSGEKVDIDIEMVPVVREVWRLGLTTTACCQNVGDATAALRDLAVGSPNSQGEGFIAFHQEYALLKLPQDDARRLATMLLETPLGDRVRQRWQEGSWRIHVPIICDDNRMVLADTALIHFPRGQIHDLTQALGRL